MALLQIPRIKSLSQSEFVTKYLETGKPVVLEGIAEAWPAIAKWSSEYLADHAGDTEVKLRSIDLSRWPSTFMREDKTTFRQYLSNLEIADEEDQEWPRLRLAEIPLGALSPLLALDIGQSPYGKSAPEEFSVMVSSGTTAALHYHPRSEAISYQIRGSRRFILASPSQTAYMDPMPVEGPLANFGRRVFSEDSIAELDIELHDATLAAGDAIFIPIHWWHTVFSSQGLSVLAVDFFRHEHVHPIVNTVAQRIHDGDIQHRKKIEDLKPKLEAASNPIDFLDLMEKMLKLARLLDDKNLEKSLLKRGLAALSEQDERIDVWRNQLSAICQGCNECKQKQG